MNLTPHIVLTSCFELTGNLRSRALDLFSGVKFFELVVAIIIFISIHSLRQQKHYGLPIWPFVGMLPSLLVGLHYDAYEWVTNILNQQNCTFKFKGPWLTSLHCVVTADPRNLEYILKTKFSNFPKGEFFLNTVYDLLGNGIFSSDHENWSRQRKTASLEVHSSEFRKMTIQCLVELVHSRLLLVLEDSIEKCSSIDLQDVLLRLTFDNVCMLAFGVDPGCLRLGLPEIQFAKAFEDATEMTLLRFVTPMFVWKIMRYLNLGSEKKLKESIYEVDKFAKEVIYRRKKELALLDNSKNDIKKSKSDLLTAFMLLKDDKGKPFSDKFLRDICVNFILAGRDTSSVALSWFFWLVDQNPNVEKKILEEISSIIAERENLEDEKNKDRLVFRPEEVKKMDYLQAALSETLRLYPSVPIDHKEVVEDDIFPNGTILKKGTKVLYAIHAMGRMESLWGKDCRDYKPERWLKDGKFNLESPYKFTAFNGGPRLCLAKDFAYYQMKFVAASILYRYKVKVVKNHVVIPKLAMTLYLKYGLKVTLSKR